MLKNGSSDLNENDTVHNRQNMQQQGKDVLNFIQFVIMIVTDKLKS